MTTKRKSPAILMVLAIILFMTILSLSIFKNKPSLPVLKQVDIKFDEYVYDFGRAKQGEQIEHVFKFRNVGDKKLIIKRVNATCGCTAAFISDKNILPNGESEITTSFNTAGYEGFVNKSIYIDSNAPSIQLEIQGIVEVPLSVAPENINFGNLKQGVEESRKIYITKGGDENLKVLKAETSSDYLIVQIKELPQDPPDKYRKRFEIEVATTPDLPIGVLNETVTVYTNDKDHLKIEVPVSGNIRTGAEQSVLDDDSSLLIFPPLFFFGSVKQGETPSQKINIQTTGSEPLKIEKTENHLEDFISITVNPKIEGKEYEITASVKDNVPTGKTEGFIIIYTNDPGKPYIEIPVNISIEQ